MNLIDTHVWIWLIRDPDKISEKARQALDKDDQIGISVISCWEICLLCAKGRLNLEIPAVEWIHRAKQQHSIYMLQLDEMIASIAGSTQPLDWTHPDPADRLIVATARSLDLPLITADQTIQRYPGVTTIW